MNEQTPGTTMLKVGEVAARLSLSKSTIYKMIETGQLRAIRPSRRSFRVPSLAVDEILGNIRSHQPAEQQKG